MYDEFAGGSFGTKQDFSTSAGGTDVTSSAVIPANRVVIGDDGAFGVKAAIASINDAGGYSSTIASGGNTVALTLVQNDTVNNPRVVSLTNAGTGNTLFIDANADAGSAASTSGALLIENTGNAGFGLNVYSNHATFAQSLSFMKLDNSGATGNVLRLDNDGTGHAILTNQNGSTSVSTSVGGAWLLTNTLNNGSGLVVFSNNGTNTANAVLISGRADNVAFTGNIFQATNNGLGWGLSINSTGGLGGGVTASAAGDQHTLAISYTGTNPIKAAGSFTSSNTAFTALEVSGHEFGHGTIKVSHVGDGISSDGNAAALSIDLKASDAGTGTTAAQGIFVTATQGGTTGAILQLKNNMLALGGADLQVGIMYLSAGGNLGLGTPTATTPTEKLTLGLLGTGKPILMMAETTAPTATAGSGKLWYSSTDSQLHSMDDGGNDWLVQVVPLGADKGVRTAGTNFTTIQGALDDGGETIYVTDQTFTITSQLLLKSSSTKLNLSGGAIIQNNGAVVTTLIAPNTTGLSRIEISGGKFLQTNATAQGIAFDLSDTPNLWMSRTRIEEYGTGIQIIDAASSSFYSSFRDIQMFNVNNGISLGGTQPNLNLWDNVRIRPKTGGGGTGINLVDTRGNTFLHCDVEPAAGGSAGITGIHLDATTRDNLFLGCWIENNATGVLIDALASNNVFIGGSITSNTGVDITDNGTDTVFWGVNRTGTKLYKVPRITDVLGNEIVIFSATASAVNELTIANAAAAGSPTISATGGDTDINITLTPKGAGTVISSGKLGVGVSPTAFLHVLGTTEQARFAYDASNYTSFTVSSAGAMTVTGTSGSSGQNFQVSGMPFLATNITQTNTTSTSGNLFITSGGGAGSATTNANYLFAGASNVMFRVGSRGSTAAAPTADHSAANFVMGTMVFTEAASGTHALLAGMVLRAPTVTNGAGATANTATLYIDAAPSGITPTGQNYSLWIDAGLPRIDSTSANGSVATVLGSLGPAGSNTTVQEWLTVDINGTTRYIPCF